MLIYQIVNISTGKRYIGQTSNPFYLRKAHHLHYLRNGKHKNKFIQRAFDKYGETDFVFEVIRNVTENIDLYEEKYIQLFQSNNPLYGYNLREVCHSNKGIKFGPQSQEHLWKRVNKSIETKRINNSASKGINHMNWGRFYTLEERKLKSRSEFPGTKYDKRRQKWQARIHINDRDKHLGYFDDQESAFAAYLVKYYELEREHNATKLPKGMN